MADGGMMTAQQAQAVLGVEASVDDVALRRAFHQAVKACHPDRPGGDAERLRAVIEAYRRLEGAPAGRPVRQPPPASPARRGPTMIISPAAAAIGGVMRVVVDGQEAIVRLPAGLRHGDHVRIADRVSTVDVRGNAAAAVLGDHLCLTVPVSAALLRGGGRIFVDAPQGALQVWVSGDDAARGLVRVRGQGLPARGARQVGDLFVRLKPAALAEAETAARSKRRRFAAIWAA
jgi:curved DNA-binding protein